MQSTFAKNGRPSILALLTLCIAALLHGQSFPSGSTGADGDLVINTPGPTAFTTAPVGGGSVYNFKSIQIASGSTLVLSGGKFPNPIYFLSQGAVIIAGTIDLSGQSGTQVTTPAQRTGPTVPGSGGYGGGAVSFAGNPALPGLGPAGGRTGAICIIGTGYGAGSGGFTGNQFLVPLVGGSGGAGSDVSGGAGGGALLIASSVSITVDGAIVANGGNALNISGFASGNGGGGGVRLVAPTISGTGTITAVAGTNGCKGTDGVVRLEFFQNTFTGTVGGTLYLATPVNLFIPALTDQPSIVVTSIGGVPIPPNPTGSFTVPDVALNSNAPLPVSIHATNIPLGTTATLYFSTENFPDQQIVSTQLGGDVTSSTATATVTLNPGFSKGYIVATWTQ